MVTVHCSIVCILTVPNGGPPNFSNPRLLKLQTRVVHSGTDSSLFKRLGMIPRGLAFASVCYRGGLVFAIHPLIPLGLRLGTFQWPVGRLTFNYIHLMR